MPEVVALEDSSQGTDFIVNRAGRFRLFVVANPLCTIGQHILATDVANDWSALPPTLDVLPIDEGQYCKAAGLGNPYE
ncbi:MAG TPA: hypothetical protein VJS37_20010 [Terriglobales bacterium]|nr:hypothetical protein [Terriglobales bacterium]